MSDALPVAVVLPIVGAALTFIAIRMREPLGWWMAFLTGALEVVIAGLVLRDVLADGRFTHELAGFPPPAGIELVADGLSAPVFGLVAITAFAVLVYARGAGPHRGSFYVGYLLLVGGLAGVTLTGDLFNMYVFLEITGLAAYALVASAGTGRSAYAAFKYLLIGTVGASLFLLGVGYAYVATGTLNMADLADRLAVVGYDSRLVIASFALVVTGLVIKTALYPVHTWQPEAYASAPDSVSTFISALVSTVAAYAIARVLFSVFTVEFFVVVPEAQQVLLVVASISVVAGSALAVMQSEVKRMLAYSSVSQYGIVIAAFAVAEPTAIVGAIILLVGHALMKGGLFAAVGAIATATGATTVEDYGDLAARAPTGSFAFAVLAFALVGVPPAVGFIGKWYIVLGAVGAEVWLVAGVLLTSTLLTLAYFARLIERVYFGNQPDPDGTMVADGGEAVPLGMTAVAVGAAIATVVLGLAGAELASALEPTAHILLDR